ncbi:MAG: DUF4097 family beta strand repeat protein [Candidatus Wallbacteria bacterium]|nr:DUF4097 family beta strand repeat protein [Candidatus Wallbacteria bacterium]
MTLEANCRRLLMAMLAMGAATGTLPAAEYKDVLAKNLELAGATKLVVGHVTGTIDIQGGDVKEVSVRAVKRVEASSEADAKKALDRVKVEIAVTGGVLEVRTRYDDESTWQKLRDLVGGGGLPKVSVDLTIALPKAWHAQVTTVSGEVSIRELSGGLQLKGVSGSLKANGLAGGAVEAHSVSGNIDLAWVKGGYAGASLHTVSGNAALSLPVGVGATVEFHSVSGAIEVAGGSGSGRWNGKLGAGGPALEIHTVSGSAKIKTAP